MMQLDMANNAGIHSETFCYYHVVFQIKCVFENKFIHAYLN